MRHMDECFRDAIIVETQSRLWELLKQAPDTTAAAIERLEVEQQRRLGVKGLIDRVKATGEARIRDHIIMASQGRTRESLLDMFPKTDPSSAKVMFNRLKKEAQQLAQDAYDATKTRLDPGLAMATAIDNFVLEQTANATNKVWFYQSQRVALNAQD